MATDFGLVSSAALSLSEAERAELAARLLDSLDGPPDDDAEEAWKAEVARRAADGGAATVPWSEVRAALLGQAESHGRR